MTKMATMMNLWHQGILSALKPDGLSFIKSGSLQPIYKSQHQPAVTRIEMVKQSHGPTCSTNHPTLHAHFKSPSEVKTKTVEAKTTEVGVGVFILKDNKVLFGRRLATSIISYTYGLPGGHLEFGETFEECALREVKEETGLDIKNIEWLTKTSNPLSNEVCLDIIYMSARLSDPDQTPQNIEPDKCDGWNWYDLKNLPEPTFGPLVTMLQDGFNPFPTYS